MKMSTAGGDQEVRISEWEQPGVYLFEFTNAHGMSLTLSNYGAAVVSCTAPDRLGKWADVVLGYDTLRQYIDDDYYMGTVVGRYANRIRYAKVNICGKEFNLASRSGGFHHHGGKLGFNKKLFSAEVFRSDQKRGLKLFYLSPDGEEGYPGNLHLTVTYTLHDDNSWGVDYNATTDQPTILNPTQHTYFNLSGYGARPVTGHYLQIPADSYLQVDDQFIPDGDIKPVSKTVYDFRKPVRIGSNMEAQELSAGRGFDNTWVLAPGQGDHLKHAATAMDPESGRILQVFTTEPSVHFYSGNFLEDGTPGKRGERYSCRSGFCLETQHFPDSPHHSHFPSTVLLPGDKFHSTTIFKFSKDL